MTERLHFQFSLSCIGEGNSNPLQCSCLENPRDGGAGGLLSMGSHRVRHDWSDLAAAAEGEKMSYVLDTKIPTRWRRQLQYMMIHCSHNISKSKSLSRVWLFMTPWTIESMEFSRPESWSGSLSLLQGIFLIQRLNSGLLQCRWILHKLSHKGSPRILEWVAYPFSSGSFRPRNWTGVSCIAAIT